VSRLLDTLRSMPSVRWSAAVTIEADGQEIAGDAMDAEVILPTASIGKLFLLATVLDDIEQRRMGRDELLDVTAADRVADSGLLQHLDGQRASVIDLCRFVGAVSDNLATNVLIRRVGLDRVASTGRRLGLTRCALHDVVRDSRGPEHPPHLSTGAAGELCALMRGLHANGIISPFVSAGLIELLRINTDLSMVAAAFALDPLAHVDEDIGIRLFNKTGTQRGTRADVGCLEAGEWVATYAVIGRFDDSAPARLAVLDAMRAVGTVLLEAVQQRAH
jgi:beta-lactamase class A